MDAEFKAKWIAALRSGEYKQCKASLRTGDGFCCLGVAAVVAGYSIDESRDHIVRPGGDPELAQGYWALEDFGLRDRGHLINMNDDGKSFSDIADYIEAHL